MSRTLSLYAATIVALLLIVGGGYLAIRQRTGAGGAAATTTASSTIPNGVGVQVSGSGHVTVTEGSGTSAPAAPNFRKPLTFGASVSADAQVALQKIFNAEVTTLSKDQTNFEAWANLAVVRKSAGDYAGAEEDWLYMTRAFPSSTVAFDSLGELYLDFLKNYPKAEANFKTSISLDAHDINAYQQLFSLYTVYGYKANTTAAADLIAQGLKDNPNDETLLQLKAQLK